MPIVQPMLLGVRALQRKNSGSTPTHRAPVTQAQAQPHRKKQGAAFHKADALNHIHAQRKLIAKKLLQGKGQPASPLLGGSQASRAGHASQLSGLAAQMQLLQAGGHGLDIAGSGDAEAWGPTAGITGQSILPS